MNFSIKPVTDGTKQVFGSFINGKAIIVFMLVIFAAWIIVKKLKQ